MNVYMNNENTTLSSTSANNSTTRCNNNCTFYPRRSMQLPTLDYRDLQLPRDPARRFARRTARADARTAARGNHVLLLDGDVNLLSTTWPPQRTLHRRTGR